MPVIPGLWEAKVRGSLEERFETSLGNIVKYVKKIFNELSVVSHAYSPNYSGA